MRVSSRERLAGLRGSDDFATVPGSQKRNTGTGNGIEWNMHANLQSAPYSLDCTRIFSIVLPVSFVSGRSHAGVRTGMLDWVQHEQCGEKKTIVRYGTTL